MCGYVAQLAEHWTFNPQVLGSNPNIPKFYQYTNDNFEYNLYFKYCYHSIFNRNIRPCFE